MISRCRSVRHNEYNSPARSGLASSLEQPLFGLAKMDACRGLQETNLATIISFSMPSARRPWLLPSPHTSLPISLHMHAMLPMHLPVIFDCHRDISRSTKTIHQQQTCRMYHWMSLRCLAKAKRQKKCALHQGIEPWSPALDEILLLTSGNHDH